eukprot:CAMPEP_0179151084 /NCGR_PEP_ID=MMETSP0796-20121207/73323_1 /TAXON_ID=73915 /ORGANISM="Pyrodinium bahamense, Strain pbaha01" /LENGTH=37 /DNA_ID= /DNA_START= /DNA_END= /DNA_ORIENTATION=
MGSVNRRGALDLPPSTTPDFDMKPSDKSNGGVENLAT